MKVIMQVRKKSDHEVEVEPKMSKKRTSLTGFSKEETSNRIKNKGKYKPSSDWRKITQIKIDYTNITKIWWYNVELPCKEEYIIPFGMLKTLEKLFSHSKCYHSHNVLSDNVRRALNVTSENYDKNKMKLTITHKGNRGIKSFYYIYCSICYKDELPIFLDKYKLPNKPKIIDLIEA